MLGHSACAGGAADTGDSEGEGDESADESSEASMSDASLASSDADMADNDSEADSEEGQQAKKSSAGAAEAGMEVEDIVAAAAAKAYAGRDVAGTPRAVLPKLVTLSMLPRTQWQNLAHLDTIRVRNKPIQPPKKPEAAPFFLPTVAGADAGRNPVFDLAGAAAAGGAGAGSGAAEQDPLAAAAAAAWGGGESEGEEGEEEEQGQGRVAVDFDADADGGSSSSEGEESDGEEGGKLPQRSGSVAAVAAAASKRIVRSGGRGVASGLVGLLRSCSTAGDWTSLVAYLRGLAPVQVDSQLREMQVRPMACGQGRAGLLSPPFMYILQSSYALGEVWTPSKQQAGKQLGWEQWRSTN